MKNKLSSIFIAVLTSFALISSSSIFAQTGRAIKNAASGNGKSLTQTFNNAANGKSINSNSQSRSSSTYSPKPNLNSTNTSSFQVNNNLNRPSNVVPNGNTSASFQRKTPPLKPEFNKAANPPIKEKYDKPEPTLKPKGGPGPKL